MQLLTYAQAAEKLACSVSTIKRMVADDTLVRVPVGKRGSRVAAEDLDAYIRRQLGADEPVFYEISPGKRDAFFAKCGNIARLTETPKSDVVDEWLARATEKLGREISSVKDLSGEEASELLDELDAEVQSLKRSGIGAVLS